MPRKLPSYINETHEVMLFVDGENFAIRAKEIINKKPIQCGNIIYKEDVYLWSNHVFFYSLKGPSIKRAYYYTVLTGDSDAIEETCDLLKKTSITDPVVIKKPKGTSRKFVDIQLSCDVLAHSFRNNLDCVILVAGDKDYVPLIKEIKRCGKSVAVWFWKRSVAKELLLEADVFLDLEEYYFDCSPDLLVRLS